MKRISFLVIFLLGLPALSDDMSVTRSRNSGSNCRHEKTVGALPAGAPLPDVDVPQHDQITTEYAYETAKKYLSKNCEIDATEYFERAIGSLRRTKGEPYNKGLATRVVLDYVQLLRAHAGISKASKLEEEFLSSEFLADSAQSRQQQPIETVTDPVQANTKTPPGIVLFTNSEANKKRRAYLIIDETGKPALYSCVPFFKGEKASKLQTFSTDELKTIWQLSPSPENYVSCQFMGWTKEHEWGTYQIELKFKDGLCEKYKVQGPGIKVSSWISPKALPEPFIPVEISCIEGPSDTTDCGSFRP